MTPFALAGVQFAVGPQALRASVVALPPPELLAVDSSVVSRDLSGGAASSVSASPAVTTPSLDDEYVPPVPLTNELLRNVNGVVEDDEAADHIANDLHRVESSDEAQVRDLLHKKLQDCLDRGMPSECVEELRMEVMGPLFQLFRTTISNDPPADVPPMTAEFLPSVESVRLPPRRYTPIESQFMKFITSKLEAFGLVRRTSGATVVSPAYPVRKPGVPPDAPIEDLFRLVVNLKGVNKHTKRRYYPATRLDRVTTFLSGFKCAAHFDLISFFWQLLVDPEIRAYFTFATDEGTFEPSRVPQGFINSADHCQSVVNDLLVEFLYHIVMSYQDDLLVRGRDPRELVRNQIVVMRRLHSVGLKINLLKSEFYVLEVLFCGRVFSASGISYNPSFVSAVANLPRPVTAADLQSFIGACNWVRDCVPQFAQLIAPLQQLLTVTLQGVARRNARTAKKLLLRWGAEHDLAHAYLVEAIVNATQLAYPLDDHCLVCWSDASSDFMSGVVTQCLPEELEKPIDEQRHQPLSFFSKAFTPSQRRWSTVEREGYALVVNVLRNRHVLHSSRPIHIFTDARNVSFLLNLDPDLSASSRQASDRVQRWIIALRAFDYVLQPIPGVKNHFSDLLTRFGAQHDNNDPVIQPSVMARAALPERRRSPRQHASSAAADAQPLADAISAPSAVEDPPSVPGEVPVMHASSAHHAVESADPSVDIVPSRRARRESEDPSFAQDVAITFTVEDCPPEREILLAQLLERQRGVSVPTSVSPDDTGALRTESGQLYVPQLRHLRLRLAIVAHQGKSGHRGLSTTLANLRQFFWWPTMSADVSRFVSGCLQCLMVKGPHIIPRPLLSAMHATDINKVIQFDYLSIREPPEHSTHSFKSVLALMCVFSRYIVLVPTSSSDSSCVVQSLLDWIARFGIMEGLKSDRGQHFMATVVSDLCRMLRAKHHFVTPYSPFANGHIEAANRRIVEILTAIIADAKLDMDDWPYVLPVVASVMNSSPSTVLGGLSPMEVFLGRKPSSPLSVVFLPDQRHFSSVRPSADAIVAAARALRNNLATAYDRVISTPARRRHPRPNEQEIDFCIGDFVLVSFKSGGSRDKVLPAWTGPYRVIEAVDPRAFIVEDLITKQRKQVHAQYLKLYADASLTVTPELLDHVAHASRGHVISSILEHDLSGPQPMLRVEWESSDPTWEPLSSLHRDAPAAVEQYLRIVSAEERAQLRAHLAK
jgi:hypothetical protein